MVGVSGGAAPKGPGASPWSVPCSVPGRDLVRSHQVLLHVPQRARGGGVLMFNITFTHLVYWRNILI